MEQKLKELVELPQVKLVIDLDDIKRDPHGIISSFVLTGEVDESLCIILKRINEKKGCGIFLKGNFGSGKSHFLSYLSLILQYGSDEIRRKADPGVSSIFNAYNP